MFHAIFISAVTSRAVFSHTAAQELRGIFESVSSFEFAYAATKRTVFQTAIPASPFDTG